MEKKRKLSKIFGFVAMGLSFVAIIPAFLPMIKIDVMIASESLNIFNLMDYAKGSDDILALAIVYMVLAGLLVLNGLLVGILSIFNKKGTRITSTVFAFLNLFVGIGTIIPIFIAKGQMEFGADALKPGIGSILAIVLTLLVAVFVLIATIFCPSKAALAAEAEAVDSFDFDPMGAMGNSGDTVNLNQAVAGGCITFLGGSCAGYQIPINAGEEICIGKDPSQCAIVVDKSYAKVSRKHCGVRYDAMQGVYLVTDYSTNGTNIVGGGKLSPNSTSYLERGTTLNLANTDNTFRLD